jgi:hypothetical protein
MLFDLTFPCYLTTFSGKKCLSGKVIFFRPAFFCPAYRSSPVQPMGEGLHQELHTRYQKYLDQTELPYINLHILEETLCEVGEAIL